MSAGLFPHPSFQILKGLGLRALNNAQNIGVRCLQAER
jgi:hypothetical protein